ncbi:shikimate dehydrogenase [Alphaproteobacteria bacterium KMM 3653]|uniref:Shikimate dehydrogenase (NADP(+)) n=1 Tax=Harenicola maris TaxID=2841044 RepID=A0AAP2CPH6_9RHOB|nr:shikimate dehydrogenase [Harenicola maris]
MTDKIPLAGVIGSPIAHSLSPRLHGHWLRETGVRGHYIPMDVTHADLERVLETLPRIGFVGLNVTLPHKELAISLADSVSDRAALIGAANTLTFLENGSIYADNTDGYGFIANLRDGAPEWMADDGPALVIGAGGASRAVLAALLEAGVPEIRLCNRSRSRAEALGKEFGARVKVHDMVELEGVAKESALLVNATSLGMTGKGELKFPTSAFAPGKTVTDLVYTPLETQFLADARAAGCAVVDGLGMLMHQGVPGFERWFGVRPTVSTSTRSALLF